MIKLIEIIKTIKMKPKISLSKTLLLLMLINLRFKSLKKINVNKKIVKAI